MLKTRIQTAVLLLIPVILALYAGGIAAKLLVLAVFVAINFELLQFTPMFDARERSVRLSLLILLPLGFLAEGVAGFISAFAFSGALTLALEVISMERARHEHSRLESLAVSGLSFLYTGFLGTVLLGAVSRSSSGMVFWLLFTVIAADTGAYFTGRAIGGALLCPRVSPKKTISGAIGGLLSAGAVSVGFTHWLGVEANPLLMFGWGLLVAVLSIFGDLVESLVKRTFGQKDSGTLLPGHGGVLDRVDALLFAAPVLYLFSW